ncbi:hypothetical protein JTE90_002701 [Oedothorax gibbosus]|uniref:Uncharacterized protein n=1 Tax=Oedothorax gibbosus TaxID=931172 RepID=A0AAV6VY73_9ARAC|nr:hypothetical protein JTE90_002701 [Oedothorax gibbosus]
MSKNLSHKRNISRLASVNIINNLTRINKTLDPSPLLRGGWSHGMKMLKMMRERSRSRDRDRQARLPGNMPPK